MNINSQFVRTVLLPLAFLLLSMLFLKYMLGGKGLLLILLSCFSLVCFILGMIKWRMAIYLFLLWFLIEGVLRKWILPEYATELFFFKYLILVGPIVQTFKNGINVSKKDYPFYSLLLMYILWGLFETFNPRYTEDIRVKILGLMIHFSFIPLVLIVPKLFKDRKTIINFMKMAVYVSIPIFIFGVIQYYSPHDSVINKYVGDTNVIAKVGKHTRVTSVFPYLSPYVSYLIFVVTIIFLRLFIGFKSVWENIILIIALILGVVNLFMTGSRGAFMSIMSILFLIFISMLLLGYFRNKRRLVSIILVVIASFAFMTFSDYAQDSYSALMGRFESGGTESRITATLNPFKYFYLSGYLGLGIGTTYQGSQRITGSDTIFGIYLEEEPERIMVELGAIGLILVTLLRLSIIIFTYRMFKRIKEKDFRLILLMLLFYQIPILFGLQTIIYNSIQNAIYWFMVGLIISIKNIYSIEKARYFGITSR